MQWNELTLDKLFKSNALCRRSFNQEIANSTKLLSDLFSFLICIFFFLFDLMRCKDYRNNLHLVSSSRWKNPINLSRKYYKCMYNYVIVKCLTRSNVLTGKGIYILLIWGGSVCLENSVVQIIAFLGQLVIYEYQLWLVYFIKMFGKRNLIFSARSFLIYSNKKN